MARYDEELWKCALLVLTWVGGHVVVTWGKRLRLLLGFGGQEPLGLASRNISAIVEVDWKGPRRKLPMSEKTKIAQAEVTVLEDITCNT
jgi:hypothetical protein